MNDDKFITPKKQGRKSELRDLFLKGVLREALAEGYGVEDRGRMFVVALRAWEGR